MGGYLTRLVSYVSLSILLGVNMLGNAGCVPCNNFRKNTTPSQRLEAKLDQSQTVTPLATGSEPPPKYYEPISSYQSSIDALDARVKSILSDGAVIALEDSSVAVAYLPRNAKLKGNKVPGGVVHNGIRYLEKSTWDINKDRFAKLLHETFHVLYRTNKFITESEKATFMFEYNKWSGNALKQKVDAKLKNYNFAVVSEKARADYRIEETMANLLEVWHSDQKGPGSYSLPLPILRIFKRILKNAES